MRTFEKHVQDYDGISVLNRHNQCANDAMAYSVCMVGQSRNIVIPVSLDQYEENMSQPELRMAPSPEQSHLLDSTTQLPSLWRSNISGHISTTTPYVVKKQDWLFTSQFHFRDDREVKICAKARV
jgi:hypothetical protein